MKNKELVFWTKLTSHNVYIYIYKFCLSLMLSFDVFFPLSFIFSTLFFEQNCFGYLNFFFFFFFNECPFIYKFLIKIQYVFILFHLIGVLYMDPSPLGLGPRLEHTPKIFSSPNPMVDPYIW